MIIDVFISIILAGGGAVALLSFHSWVRGTGMLKSLPKVTQAVSGNRDLKPASSYRARLPLP